MSCLPFDEFIKKINDKFSSKTSKIDLKNITKPMQKMLNKEEVSKEDVEQCNQDTEGGIKQVTQEFADAAVECTKVSVNDSPEEKKAKVTYFVKIKQFLSSIFDWILGLLKECINKILSCIRSVGNAIYSSVSSVGNAIYSSVSSAISSVYYCFSEGVSQVAVYLGWSVPAVIPEKQQEEKKNV